jgi:hypothetical protein
MKCNWLLLALLTLAVPAAATEMYSWTDANGTKHFSDSPPPASVKAQRVKVKGGVTSNEPVEDPAKADAAKSAGPALAAAAGYSPEDIKRNCDIAKQNRGVAEGSKIAVDAQGYPTDLDAVKTRQAQIEKANQQIKLFCH